LATLGVFVATNVIARHFMHHHIDFVL
jgi:hypothetical protein